MKILFTTYDISIMVKQLNSENTYSLLGMDYLIMVDYQSDAERKRIDYAIERWKGEGSINKPKGMVIHFSGDDVDSFLDDIYSRLSGGKEPVHVFAGDMYSPSIAEQSKHLEYSTEMDARIVEKFLNYILNKLGASFEGRRDEIKEYTAYTKKGQVGIDIQFVPAEKTGVRIFLRGYGDVVDFVAGRIDSELKVFLGVE